MKTKSLDDVYLFHLERAFKQFKRLKNVVFKKAGANITSDQWILLKRINEEEGTSQANLAKSAFKEPASVTRILDILEENGLIERQKIGDNRRTHSLYTTDQGKALINRILPLAREFRAIGTKGLSDEEVQSLVKMLDKIARNFSA